MIVKKVSAQTRSPPLLDRSCGAQPILLEGGEEGGDHESAPGGGEQLLPTPPASFFGDKGACW